MRKTSFIVFLLTLSWLISHAQGQDSLMADSAFWVDGQKKYHFIYLDGIHDYKFMYWFENGKIQKEGEYKQGDIYLFNSWDSLGKALVVDSNGYHFDYYEHGEIIAKGSIKNSLKDSIWMEYYPHGQIKSKGEFESEPYYVRKIGVWTYWYPNGEIRSVGKYINNVKRGNWKYYNLNGKMKAEIDYISVGGRTKEDYIQAFDSNGNLTLKDGTGSFYEYYPNGNLKKRTRFEYSRRDSVFSYYQNGKAKEIRIYLMTTNKKRNHRYQKTLMNWDSLGNAIIKEENEWRYTFYDNGVVKYKSYSSKENYESYWIKYYPNGEMMVYSEGNGIYTTFYNNGQVYEIRDGCSEDGFLEHFYSKKWWLNGNLREDRLEGTWIDYYPNGQKKTIGYFSQEDSFKTSKDTMNAAYYIGLESFSLEYDNDFLYEVSQHPERWRKTWYISGQIKSVVEYDSMKNSLVMKQYHENGVLKAIGELRYDSWDYVSKSKDLYFRYNKFKGYLKCEVWKFYDEKGNLTKERNFDLESVDKRRMKS